MTMTAFLKISIRSSRFLLSVVLARIFQLPARRVFRCFLYQLMQTEQLRERCCFFLGAWLQSDFDFSLYVLRKAAIPSVVLDVDVFKLCCRAA